MSLDEPKVAYIPTAMRDKALPPTYQRYLCGYCATGSHDYCPRGIRAGDGHLMLCPCKAHAKMAADEIKCTECKNSRVDELDKKMWLCLDRGECTGRVRSRLHRDPQMQLIHKAYLRADETKAKEAPLKAARRAASPNGRPSSGRCLCCGETTGGGKFLPGHDARLVSITAKAVNEGMKSPATAVAEFKALGVSDALVAKLERKLAR